MSAPIKPTEKTGLLQGNRLPPAKNNTPNKAAQVASRVLHWANILGKK